MVDQPASASATAKRHAASASRIRAYRGGYAGSSATMIYPPLRKSEAIPMLVCDGQLTRARSQGSKKPAVDAAGVVG